MKGDREREREREVNDEHEKGSERGTKGKGEREGRKVRVSE